ncbi:sialidase [Luteitalea sp. TBR-22]|uniref:sialidase family protein n=1 Tax=Luteitalea sp. TBR-22 TaxID=2802971 RepID=UPI001AFC99EF|nr:sialidase family protein [Luteitalea sp. TBR-22]BCS34238.1 sialidase [Luteitalea sp. TBR-22]
MTKLAGVLLACLAFGGGVGVEPARPPTGQPPAAATWRDPEQVDVFVSGEGGYHTYRIPSIIATSSGALLAFAEARKGGAGDAGDIDLVSRRSEDGGRTWGPMMLVGDNGPNTFGNPCPVIDRDTGTIWLLTTHNRGTDRERDILAGTSAGTRTVWVLKSLDEGRTWSTPVEITASTKQADWTWYATGPGIGIQLQGGRLVIPANHAVAGTQAHRSHVVYSDDHGASWRIGAIAPEGTNESQAVELADGRLMLNMRNHPPRPRNLRAVAVSGDGGRTLGPLRFDEALPEPPAQASLLRYSTTESGGRALLLFTNPSGRGRERMTIRLSEDEGETWPFWRVLHEGPAAYSCLVVLRDGTIGVLYERGQQSAYERLTFARVDLAWVRQGR